MPKSGTGLARLVTAIVVAGWLVAVCLPPMLLARVRSSWLEQLDRPQEQTDWDEFRRDMRQQSGREGPVQRKVPKSAEPPARVWLRDYFRLAVVAWVLFVGVLGGFFCFLVAGMLRGPTDLNGSHPTARSLAQNQPRRQSYDDKQHERDAKNTQ